MFEVDVQYTSICSNIKTTVNNTVYLVTVAHVKGWDTVY